MSLPFAPHVAYIGPGAGFAFLGIDAVFVALEVAEGEAGAALAATRRLPILGLSVTMPHKEAVADAVSGIAERLVREEIERIKKAIE